MAFVTILIVVIDIVPQVNPVNPEEPFGKLVAVVKDTRIFNSYSD